VRRLGVMLVAFFAVSASSAQAVQRSDGSTPAPAQIAQLVTNVPASTLNQVGAGHISGPQAFSVVKLHRQLRSHGKPELLTMNLAWCPHCAANSWALAVALSRFGTLTGLRTINTGTYYCSLTHSSCTLTPSPCYPNTHGLSFLDAGYHSPYLHFAAVVLEDVRGHRLEQPTRSEGAVINGFDPQGGTPAVAVGGFGFVNSGYDPVALVHKTWTQIAGRLADPHSPIAQHIDGLANLFTAAICKATGGLPAAVCKSRGVSVAGAAHLH
jgi:Domain of unknown function (DUF929)